MKKNIISIQSQVATGYVGNNSAILALQLCGLDPVHIPTVLLSNSVEYPIVYGEATPQPILQQLFRGLEENNIPHESPFLITGFCNNDRVINDIADFISNTKGKSGYQYVYDPVYGDFRANGLYIPESAAKVSMQKLLPFADIVTPNHFELEYILGKTIKTISELEQAITENQLLQSKTIIVTGAHLKDTPSGNLEVILHHQGQTKRFTSPLVAIETMGTGDLFTAIVTAQLAHGKSLDQAIVIAISYLYASLKYAKEQNYKEFNSETLLQNAHLLNPSKI